MTSKLVPKNPSEVMVIRQITPNITTFSTPFWRFGHIKFGSRGTVVRLGSGALAVFSPVALTPEVKERVANLGEVKYIVAPDIEHHIFLGPWHEAYPKATVLGPEGLKEKRTKQKNEDVPFGVIFTGKGKESVKVDSEFDSEFDYEFVDAHMNKELVFNFKRDRTLIQADLILNLPATEQFSKTGTSATSGLLTRFFLSMVGTVEKPKGQKRFNWYFASSSNRAAFNRSMAKIDSWDFDRIIPCHGDVIEAGGKGIFQNIMEWHLQAAKKSS